MLAGRQSSSGKREAWASPAIFGGSVPRKCPPSLLAGQVFSVQSTFMARAEITSSVQRSQRSAVSMSLRSSSSAAASVEPYNGSGLAAKVQVPAIDR